MSKDTDTHWLHIHGIGAKQLLNFTKCQFSPSQKNGQRPAWNRRSAPRHAVAVFTILEIRGTPIAMT